MKNWKLGIMFHLIYLIIFWHITSGQSALSVNLPDSLVYSVSSTSSNRVKLYSELVNWDINDNLNYKLNEDNEENWENSFWPMELIRYRSAYAENKLKEAFIHIQERTAYFTRGLLEVIYANYPKEFMNEVTRLLTKNDDPEIFSLCAEYLLRSHMNKGMNAFLLHEMNRKFPKDSIKLNPVLKMLNERLIEFNTNVIRPNIAYFLSTSFAPGNSVIYSFQRPNRLYPGLVIVRKPDGSLVEGNNGHLFCVPQLALSISNLPFYLKNGNTPQGIYKMNGFEVSGSEFIGPTENIQLSLPFEIPVDSFFMLSDSLKNVWTFNKYRKFLPVGWQGYSSIYEAYYAGKAGRTAIIAHGTTIDPTYYKGEPYFPETPSLGCLCASETWAASNGRRLESDQQKLVNAIRETGRTTGYCVVLNLSNRQRPVFESDIIKIIKNAKIPIK